MKYYGNLFDIQLDDLSSRLLSVVILVHIYMYHDVAVLVSHQRNTRTL